MGQMPAEMRGQPDFENIELQGGEFDPKNV